MAQHGDCTPSIRAKHLYEMDGSSNWRELLVLLRSSDVNSAILSGQFIVETIREQTEETSTVQEPPEIFNEIITLNYITSDEWDTRCNTAYLIRILSFQYSHLLKPLLLESTSDGGLLDLKSIGAVVTTYDEKSTLLSGRSSYVVETRDGQLYKKSWLRKQRQELHKRLGLEMNSKEAKIANAYKDDVDTIEISDHDLTFSKAADSNESAMIDTEILSKIGRTTELSKPSTAQGQELCRL